MPQTPLWLKRWLNPIGFARFLLLIQAAALMLGEFDHVSGISLQGFIGKERFGASVLAAASLCLVYLSFELKKAKRRAWLLAIILASIGLLTEILHAHSLLAITINSGVLVALISERRHFVVISRPGGWLLALWRAFRITLVTVSFGVVGFWLLDKRQFGIEFGFGEAISSALKAMYLGNSGLVAHQASARLFLDVLNTLGTTNYILIGLSFFQPLADKFVGAPNARQIADVLLNRYSQSSEDYFKIWPPDKSYFMARGFSGFVAYKTVGHICLALGDPVAETKKLSELVAQFRQYCLEQGWESVFVHVPEGSKQLYLDQGYAVLQIGSSAVVNLQTFSQQTLVNKHFRNINNRFSSDGYFCQRLGKPHAPELMANLRRISNDWLAKGDRKEHQFALGYFDETYLNQCDIYGLFDAQHQLLAFTNILPVYKGRRSSIDLLRFGREAPKNAMDFLFSSLLKEQFDRGWHEFDLGIAPLHRTDEPDNLTERGLQLVYQYGGRIFSFHGLARFKDKFKPNWEANYLAFDGRLNQAPAIILALDKALAVKVKIRARL